MDTINEINNIVWADWSFDGFDTNYERIAIKLSYITEKYDKTDQMINENYVNEQVIIYCNDFIGLSFIGNWDENIIESIKIQPEGELITNSLQEIKRLYGELPFSMLGGGVKKFDSLWYELNIKLIDGNIVKVACQSFAINRQR